MNPTEVVNGCELYHGEALETLAALDVQVDAIITDFPYGTTACAWDTVIPFETMWKQVKRLLKKRGAFVTTASQPFTSALVMSNPKWFRDELIYKKNKASRFLDANIRPMKAHENIIVFGETLPTYNPQMDFVGIKDRRNIFTSRVGVVETLRGGLTIHSHSKDSGHRYPKTFIEINNADTRESDHPTQKPVALYEYLIRTYTNPGDTVMDFCMGSGTTGEAAINTGRKFIGVEKDKGYFKIAVKRIAQSQPPLFVDPPTLPVQAKQGELI